MDDLLTEILASFLMAIVITLMGYSLQNGHYIVFCLLITGWIYTTIFSNQEGGA